MVGSPMFAKIVGMGRQSVKAHLDTPNLSCAKIEIKYK